MKNPPKIDGEGTMNTTVIAVISSGASLIVLIIAVVVCICCYRRKDYEYDDHDDVDYLSVPSKDDEPQREDVKKLRKHSWKERTKSPFLTRKTIKFERPSERKYVSEPVQPDVYSQTTLNRQLGVSNKNSSGAGPSQQVDWSNSGFQIKDETDTVIDYLELENAEEGQGQAQGPDTTQAQGQSPSVARSRAASRAARAEARTHKYAVRYQADPNHDDANETPTHGAGPPVRQRTFESDTEPNMLVQDDEFDVHKLGKIQFNLKYDFQEMTLTLKIMRAIDLPAKDFSGTSDPYVKIMLLPDKKHKLQTNIKRRNLNPRWNELFAFEGFPYSKLQNRTLYMQVLDYDRFSRDDPIGEIAIPLCDADLATGQTMWKALQPCKGGSGKLGEILISMCYQPTVGRITVVVMKCRELKAKDITGTSDPYVKIWMHHEGKKIEKKKTTIKERELNPVFNESFIFNVPYEKIRQTQLVVSVMDYDRMGRNELIGSIVLGSKSGPMEVKHWNEMFSKSRQPVAQWHILKDFG